MSSNEYYDGKVHLRLSASRTARGFKNKTIFALESGTPISTYVAQESGRYEPKVGDLIKYATLLNISLNWLLTGKGHPLEHLPNATLNEKALFTKLIECENEKYEINEKYNYLKSKSSS